MKIPINFGQIFQNYFRTQKQIFPFYIFQNNDNNDNSEINNENISNFINNFFITIGF